MPVGVIMAKETTYTCTCGAESTPAEYHCNVGEMQRRSGFTWVILDAGKDKWICPKCAEKCEDMISEICQIVDSEYWTSGSFGKIKKKII